VTTVAEANRQPDEDRELEERARPYRALYEHWESTQWSPLEIDYTVDAASFAALDAERQQGFMWIFAHRFHAEYTVANVLAPFVTRAPSYELQVCLAAQLADEFRHMQSVLRVYSDVFGIGDRAQVQAAADARMDPIEEALHAEFHRFVAPLETSTDEDDFLRAVLAYHLMGEGVVARTAQNLAAGQYREYGSFPGLAEGQRLVARDEARHIGIGVSYVRQRMTGDHERTVEVVGAFAEHIGELCGRLLDTALAGGMTSQVRAGYGVDPTEFYAEAMRLWHIRLRSIGFL
jgi:ribonucleotide reductase beta subunit family protein with ferritin-like domain